MKASRTWEKLGSGLFGHRLRKKVTWECRDVVFSGQVLSTSPRDELGFQESGSIGSCSIGNFTTLEKRKCTAGDSLEPRIGGKVARLELD